MASGDGECLGSVADELCWGEGECEGEYRPPPAMDVPAEETDARYWAIVAGSTEAKFGSKPGYLCCRLNSAELNCGISEGAEEGKGALCDAPADGALGPKLLGFMNGR